MEEEKEGRVKKHQLGNQSKPMLQYTDTVEESADIRWVTRKLPTFSAE